MLASILKQGGSGLGSPNTIRAMMEVISVPCWSDNYAYIILQKGLDKAIVVDPTDDKKVKERLSEHKKTVENVFLVRIEKDIRIFKPN